MARLVNARSVGALVALSLSTFAYVTAETLPIGLLLPIADDLGSTVSAVGLLVTSYGLVVVVTSIPLTQLTRRVPRRALMSGLLGIFVVATAVSAAAPDYPALLGARVVTALSTAFLAAAGFSAAAIGPLLVIRGLAGVAGVAVGGALVDRVPLAAMIVPVALQAVALLGLSVAGDLPVLVAMLVGASGLSFAALTTALGSRVLHVAPGTQDLATAGASTAVNIGITAGALIGGLLLPAFGVRSTALIGGLLSLAALATILCEPLLREPPLALAVRSRVH